MSRDDAANIPRISAGCFVSFKEDFLSVLAQPFNVECGLEALAEIDA